MAEAMEKVNDTQGAPPPPLSDIYFLMITVIRAENLEKADWNGSSDPFVKVTAGKQSFETAHIDKELNPVWNAETSFVFFEPVPNIRFEVFDHDESALGGKHDAIGNYTLDVSNFYADGNAGCDGSAGFELADAKKGTLFVKVEGRTVKPVELEQRVESLSAEVAQQEAQLSAKRQEQATLTSQKETAMASKAQKEQEQSELNGQLKGIRERIQAQKDANAQVRTEMQTLSATSDGLKASLAEKRAAIAETKRETEAEKAKLVEAQTELGKLQKEAQQLREGKSDAKVPVPYEVQDADYSKSIHSKEDGPASPLL